MCILMTVEIGSCSTRLDRNRNGSRLNHRFDVRLTRRRGRVWVMCCFVIGHGVEEIVSKARVEWLNACFEKGGGDEKCLNIPTETQKISKAARLNAMRADCCCRLRSPQHRSEQRDEDQSKHCEERGGEICEETKVVVRNPYVQSQCVLY